MRLYKVKAQNIGIICWQTRIEYVFTEKFSNTLVFKNKTIYVILFNKHELDFQLELMGLLYVRKTIFKQRLQASLQDH